MSTEEDSIKKTFANGKPEAGGSGSGSKSTFSFRPSALSTVAESMWKKSGTGSGSGAEPSESRTLNPFGGLSANSNKSSTLKRPFPEEKDKKEDDENDSNESSLSSKSENFNEILSSKTPKRAAVEESEGKPAVFGTKSLDSEGKPAVARTGFIFGKNVQERVVGAKNVDSEGKTDETPEVSSEKEKPGNDQPSGFAAKAKASSNANTLKSPPKADSLEKSAAEFENSTLPQSSKILATDFEVTTGEEGEENLFSCLCKVYAFDVDHREWLARGRGQLRLNQDTKTKAGRIVFRIQGSLRVIINSKIWPEMNVQLASEKSVRISAFSTDSKEPGIFLITGSAKDISELQRRLLRMKEEEANST